MLEKKLLESLTKITENVYEKYSKLCELELSGKVASNEYGQIVNDIKDLMSLENDILTKIKNSNIDVDEMNVILFEEDTIDNNPNYIHIVNRISSQLLKLTNDEKYDDDDEYSELMEALFAEDEISEKDIEKTLISEFLVRLQSRINNTDLEKELLTKAKYDTCFETPTLDSDLLTARFNVNNLNIPTVSQLNDEAGVDFITGAVCLTKYIDAAFWETVDALISAETYDDPVLEKRATFKVLDLQLEIILSYLDYETIFNLKRKLESTTIPENSVAADIINENIDEALINRASHKSKIEKTFGDNKVKIISY